MAKLEWYRLGDEQSSRQWQDIIGILELNGSKLDWQYLQRMAAELGLTDLLDRACTEPED